MFAPLNAVLSDGKTKFGPVGITAGVKRPALNQGWCKKVLSSSTSMKYFVNTFLIDVNYTNSKSACYGP